MRLQAPARLLATTTAVLAMVLSSAIAGSAATRNPIIGDGSVYSADPSMLVVDDRLYIHAGRDEAGEAVNDFVMNEWQAFSTADVEEGVWEHHPALMRPETVFDWATPGRAYAGQVVEGLDGRFYWYVPVHEAASTADDKFGIGVAVADSPVGPWTDHVGGPILSQAILDNDAHNIDPTVLVDEGRVWLYWGSFGRLQAVELSGDMKSLVGEPAQITSGVTGFFEAPWLFEREGTYYLAYAANNAGPASECTPALYHACIAYSTASSPLGPWTHRGRILAPVSSTTSHPAIAEFEGKWYLAYHTADAEGGNHFRRSVAIDELQWDDTQTPAQILPVATTPARTHDLTPRANVAPWATASASNEPIPTQYWIRSLNDELIRPNPLPPDMWGTWTAERPPQHWIQYDWAAPVRVDRARIKFWRDAAPGTGEGIADPAAWRLQYWADGAWADVPDPSGYATSTDALHEVMFGPVTTSRLRAVIDASPDAAGTRHSAVAVEEWEVHAAQPDAVDAVAVATDAGAAPDLPATVGLRYGDDVVPAPVRWDDVDPADYAGPGTFAVSGFVEGYAAGRIEATVEVRGAHPWRTNLALAGAPEAESTGDGGVLTALNDGATAPTGSEPIWTSGEGGTTRWVGYTWKDPVVADSVTARFWSDGEAVGPPTAWKAQALVDGAWVDLAALDGPFDAAAPSTVTFESIATTTIRISLDLPPQDAVALSELEVHGEPADVTAPELVLEASGIRGAGDWFVSPATIRTSASDDHDLRTTIDIDADGAGWQTHENVRTVETALTEDGRHTLRARAVDAAGNMSDESVLSVRIDATAPTVEGALDVEGRSVRAAADDAVSGVAHIEYAVDAPSGWQPYDGPVVVDEQRHEVHLRAIDAAGNISRVVVVEVPLGEGVPLEGNIAPLATASASYTSGWNSVDAVNDGTHAGASWGTWPTVGEQWVQLEWDRVVTVDRVGVLFFRDAADEAGVGMIPPREWRLQYVDLASGAWRDVTTSDPYDRSSDAVNEVGFAPVSTTRLRAVMQAWGEESGGGSSGILEFEAWAAAAEPRLDVDIATTVRCVASKAVLVVMAENRHDAPVDVVIGTAYGDRTVSALAPGARASQAFTTRLAEMPAGSLEIGLASGEGEGRVADERTATYEGHRC